MEPGIALQIFHYLWRIRAANPLPISSLSSVFEVSADI